MLTAESLVLVARQAKRLRIGWRNEGVSVECRFFADQVGVGKVLRRMSSELSTWQGGRRTVRRREHSRLLERPIVHSRLLFPSLRICRRFTEVVDLLDERRSREALVKVTVAMTGARARRHVRTRARRGEASRDAGGHGVHDRTVRGSFRQFAEEQRLRLVAWRPRRIGLRKTKSKQQDDVGRSSRTHRCESHETLLHLALRRLPPIFLHLDWSAKVRVSVPFEIKHLGIGTVLARVSPKPLGSNRRKWCSRQSCTRIPDRRRGS